MDIIGMRSMCSKTTGKGDFCEIALSSFTHNDLYSVYVTEKGMVYLYLGSNGNENNYFLKLGYTVLDKSSLNNRNTKKVFYSCDGEYRFSKSSIEGLIYYIYLNNFEKSFIVRIKDTSCLIGVFRDLYGFSPLVKVILKSWSYDYSKGLSKYNHRSLGQNSNILLIKGETYMVNGYEDEYIYLGLQLCARTGIRLEDHHLFIKKPSKCRSINKYIESSLNDADSFFIFDVEWCDLEHKNLYYTGIELDNYKGLFFNSNKDL